MNPKIYDLIIIGAGPAGITSGIYAARKRMDFLILTSDIGGQTAWTGDIQNYTGYQFITGPDLVDKFEEHVKQYGLEVRENEPVIRLYKKSDIVHAHTREGEYMSRTAIIASGKRSRELGVPGEKEFKNKGVTYCATCDAPLFPEKSVAVIGGGNSAIEAALQLDRIASKIYIINNTSALGGDVITREKVVASPKVTVFNGSNVLEIRGDNFVSSIKIQKENSEKVLDVEGIFVEIGLFPNTDFLEGIAKNEKGEVLINCDTETNVEGVFAAGDVTNVMEKQIIIAAGEGAKAALSVFRYFARRK